MFDFKKYDVMLTQADDETLEALKGMSDDDLLRSAQTLDLFAVVEANRRLRVALHQEETVIRRLTWVLVALTAVLVIFPVIEAVNHWLPLVHR